MHEGFRRPHGSRRVQAPLDIERSLRFNHKLIRSIPPNSELSSLWRDSYQSLEPRISLTTLMVSRGMLSVSWLAKGNHLAAGVREQKMSAQELNEPVDIIACVEIFVYSIPQGISEAHSPGRIRDKQLKVFEPLLLI